MNVLITTTNGYNYNVLLVSKDTLSDPNSLCKLHKTTGTMTWVTISAERKQQFTTLKLYHADILLPDYTTSLSNTYVQGLTTDEMNQGKSFWLNVTTAGCTK